MRPYLRSTIVLLRRARAEERASQMDIQHRVPVVVAHLEEQVIAQHARIVDEDVKLAKRLDGGRDGLLHGIGVCETSQRTAVASEPSAVISAATRWQPSTSRSASVTRAPSSASRFAVAAPMPRPAPVTNATRPVSLPMPMPPVCLLA